MWKKSAGIILILIGSIMIGYTGFTYLTTKKVADIGSIQINQKEEHPVQWSPYIGAVILASGFILTVAGREIHV
jgi:hypothetical protein